MAGIELITAGPLCHLGCTRKRGSYTLSAREAKVVIELVGIKLLKITRIGMVSKDLYCSETNRKRGGKIREQLMSRIVTRTNEGNATSATPQHTMYCST